MEIVGALIVIFGCLFIYFLPSIVAAGRGHRQRDPIIILNLFLGWTLIGWVVALVWSFTTDVVADVKPAVTININSVNSVNPMRTIDVNPPVRTIKGNKTIEDYKAWKQSQSNLEE